MKYGYFDDGRQEYVITRPDTPAPWANYLGSPEYGALISNNAGGYSFAKSGANGRILRYVFNRDDQPGRYIYIRDNGDGDYWSASWQPVGKDLAEYKSECRHGTGYTVISAEYHGIRSEAERHGYDITFINRGLGQRETSYLQHCRYRGVDGVVIASADFKICSIPSSSAGPCSNRTGSASRSTEIWTESIQTGSGTAWPSVSSVWPARRPRPGAGISLPSWEATGATGIRPAWKRGSWRDPRNWAATPSARCRKN